jgi:hypothetical protein
LIRWHSTPSGSTAHAERVMIERVSSPRSATPATPIIAKPPSPSATSITVTGFASIHR